jgi:hypothetical protein
MKIGNLNFIKEKEFYQDGDGGFTGMRVANIYASSCIIFTFEINNHFLYCPVLPHELLLLENLDFKIWFLNLC